MPTRTITTTSTTTTTERLLRRLERNDAAAAYYHHSHKTTRRGVVMWRVRQQNLLLLLFLLFLFLSNFVGKTSATTTTTLSNCSDVVNLVNSSFTTYVRISGLDKEFFVTQQQQHKQQQQQQQHKQHKQHKQQQQQQQQQENITGGGVEQGGEPANSLSPDSSSSILLLLDSFVKAYNNGFFFQNNNATTTSCNGVGQRIIDNVTIITVWIEAGEMLLMVNATCVECSSSSSSLDEQQSNNVLFITQQQLDEEDETSNNSNATSLFGCRGDSSIITICDPPLLNDSIEIFQQELLEDFLQVTNGTASLSVSSVTISEHACESAVTTTTTSNRKSFDTTLILYFDDTDFDDLLALVGTNNSSSAPMMTTTNEDTTTTNTDFSNYTLWLLFDLLEDAVIEAYNTVNNNNNIKESGDGNSDYYSHHCDPLDRKMESVNVVSFHHPTIDHHDNNDSDYSHDDDQEDSFKFDHVIDQWWWRWWTNKDDPPSTRRGNQNGTAILLVLEATISCIGCGVGDDQQQQQHAFDLFSFGAATTTNLTDLPTGEDFVDLVPGDEHPTLCHCPSTIGDEDFRGPTLQEFQTEIANILPDKLESPQSDGGDEERPLFFIYADEVTTVACSSSSTTDDTPTQGGEGITDGPTTTTIPKKTNITQVVLVDFVVGNCTLVDDDIALLVDLFVETYNTLSRENYCDPYFRVISSATVLQRGETRFIDDDENSPALTVEMELMGSCIGCDDPNTNNDDDDGDFLHGGFYYVPTEIPTTNIVNVSINEAMDTEVTSIFLNNSNATTTPGMNMTDTNSNNNTDTMNSNNNTDTMNSSAAVNNNDNNTRHLRHRNAKGLRYLVGQQTRVCYCPTSAIGARAPSEAEVMDAFRSVVQASQMLLQCISSVGECRFGTIFETSFLLALGDDPANSTFDDFTTDLEIGLQETLNGLLFLPRPGICQPDFRLVQSVSATIGVDLAEEGKDFRRHLTTESDSRRAQQNSTTPPSEPNVTDSSSAPTPDPTTSFPRFTSYPSLPPAAFPTTPPTGVFAGNSVLVLLRVRGLCNGCSNDQILLNQISTATSRRLDNDKDPYHSLFRSLQTTETMPESNCFCPIESVVQDSELSSGTLLDAYQRQLDESAVPVDVRGIQEVQVLENCQDQSEGFNTQMVLVFALNEEVFNSNRELVKLFDLIQETYNDLTDQEYCDPLMRRIEDINLVTMERLAVGQNECDLFALTIDVQGVCRGCEDGYSLLDGIEGDEERRLLGRDGFRHEYHEKDVMDMDLSVRRRRLQDSEVCLCERARGADRAPTLDEFEDVVGPELQRGNFDSVCGLAEQFEEILVTDKPSYFPSTIPSASPSVCTVSLENEFRTAVVLFVENNEDGLEPNVANQLGLALEMALNETAAFQFSTICDPLYREVTSVSLLTGDGQSAGGERRRLRSSLELGSEAKRKQTTRQGYSSSTSSTSRIVQESESVVFFQYAVTGQCAACSAESNILDAVSSDEVLSILKKLAEPFLAGANILSVKEIDEIECSDTVVNFEEVIIVELVPTCPEEENFGFDELLLSSIEETFVSTYNGLSALYCDEFFIVLADATVQNLGTITDEGNVPLEIRVFAECLGCNPDEAGIYGNPSALGSDESSVLDNDGPIRAWLSLVDNVSNLHFWAKKRSDRFLQSINFCTCDAQALANRPPTESEFINLFRQRVESLPLDCVASVGECQFGSTFDTDIVISFEGNQTTLTEDVRQIIQESFQALLNDLFEPSEEVCDPSFRVVLDVEVIFDFTLNGEFIESSSNSTADDGLSERLLHSSYLQHRRDQGNTTTTNTDPSVSPSPAPTPAFEATPNQAQPTLPPTTVFDVNPIETPSPGSSSASQPTSSPSSAFDTSIVRTLLTVSGICNGCVSELFLSNQILNGANRRRLVHGKHYNLGGHHSDFEYLLSRHLQDQPTANSNCFCPLTAIVNIVPPSTEEVQGGLNQRLEEEEAGLVVRTIDAVSAIDCDAEEETTRFESEFTFDFSAFSTVSDMEIRQFGDVIEATYNDLVQDYCDPLIRREVDLRLTGRRRVIASASSDSGRRDLQEQGLDPTLEQELLCVNFEATFEVIGSCRGCEDGTPLLDSQSLSRGLLSAEVHNRLLSRDVPLSQQRTRRRRLMNDEDECFCDSSTIAPRAPNIDEVWFRLQPELESFVDICGQPVQCDPTVFVSQLTETTSLALLLKPGTIMSEVEILELEMTYLTAYNELQSRLRVDKCGGRYRQLTSITADQSALDETMGLGEGRVVPDSDGVGRRLLVQSYGFAVVFRCTRECIPRDDLDILRVMIDQIRSVSFVQEVLAINEFLTDTPSSIPSLQPFVAPLANQSVSPSTSLPTSPSESPSSSPIMNPSALPSLSPSETPSITPSRLPTASPSVSPSSPPSRSPSGFPSILPSLTSSRHPSTDPSIIPSGHPSTIPSEYPSEFPSEFPSAYPSTLPSTSPSSSPSSSPSTTPSTTPSALPSLVPSSSPSATPSTPPSTLPSLVPSSSPSATPSATPSALPSLVPSSFPSATPSAPPSTLPSLVPSSSPSKSQVPSAFPSPSGTCSSLLCNELNPNLPAPVSCTGSPFCECNTPTCPNCIGFQACPPSTPGPIGDNSCLGPSNACNSVPGTIGDNSCIGTGACAQASSSVGSDSCKGDSACFFSDVAIPGNACNVDRICFACRFEVFSGQCNNAADSSSCPCLPTFGSGSCVDVTGGSACFGEFVGSGPKSVIGTNSCSGMNACAQLEDTTIMDNSCNGDNACRFFRGTSIGTNSCNFDAICQNCVFAVGDDECNNDGGFCPCPP